MGKTSTVELATSQRPRGGSRNDGFSSNCGN